MKERIGVGVVGCGGVSASHFRAARENSAVCDLIAACDVNEAALRARQAQFDVPQVYTRVEELLADDRIDIVTLAVPHPFHAPVTIAAARAGKHVICEKPMALNVGEGLEMIEAHRAAGTKLAIVSECINPRHRFLKERVMPELGAITFSYLIDFYWRGRRYYESVPWRGSWAREGGAAMINQAIYTWDQIAWLLGGVAAAYGYWGNLLHPSIECEDLAYGLVRYGNGSHGKLFCTTICDAPAGLRWGLIQGERGAIFSDSDWFYRPDFTLADKSREAALKAAMPAGLQHDRESAHTLLLADLCAAIREDRAPAIGTAPLEALKILNGIHWHGWRHRAAFEQWARALDTLPADADAAKEQGWTGGAVVATITGWVTDPAPTLPAPFIPGSNSRA
jgi:predicted dehydrogenase